MRLINTHHSSLTLTFITPIHHHQPPVTNQPPSHQKKKFSPLLDCPSATRFLRTTTTTTTRPRSKSDRRAARRLGRSAPARSPPSPPHPAVLIPELIELILFHTNLRTLLVSAQRVCTSWRDVIAHSPRLQQKLFFTPSPPDDTCRGLEFNPLLLLPAFPHFFPAPKSISGPDLPPFLPAQGNGFPLGACMRLPMTDMRDGRARHLAFTRRGASWRRMVVASPAPRRVGRAVDVRAGWQQRGEPAWEVVEVEGGVRMGELFDAFFAAEARRSGSGWVAWGGVSPDWQGLGGLGRVDLVLTKGGSARCGWRRGGGRMCVGGRGRGRGRGGSGRAGGYRGRRRLGRLSGSVGVRSLMLRGVLRGHSGDLRMGRRRVVGV